jgi:hypothetical protein
VVTDVSDVSSSGAMCRRRGPDVPPFAWSAAGQPFPGLLCCRDRIVVVTTLLTTLLLLCAFIGAVIYK